MTRLAPTIHRGPEALGPLETVPALALRRAVEDPTALAVIDGATGETLTRGELAARSAALAAGLRVRGVGAGDLPAQPRLVAGDGARRVARRRGDRPAQPTVDGA